MRVQVIPRSELSPKYDVFHGEYNAVWYCRDERVEGWAARWWEHLAERRLAPRNGDRSFASVSSPGFSADGEKQSSVGRA